MTLSALPARANWPGYPTSRSRRRRGAPITNVRRFSVRHPRGPHEPGKSRRRSRRLAAASRPTAPLHCGNGNPLPNLDNLRRCQPGSTSPRASPSGSATRALSSLATSLAPLRLRSRRGPVGPLLPGSCPLRHSRRTPARRSAASPRRAPTSMPSSTSVPSSSSPREPRPGGHALPAPVWQGPLWLARLRKDVQARTRHLRFAGIDRNQGCTVVVRPDQYIAHILSFDAHDALAGFFDGFMHSAA